MLTVPQSGPEKNGAILLQKACCDSTEPLLTAQQLASAVAGVMPGGPPALNQPILIPFNMAGQLGGQQGLVLTLPTANLTNIQGLVAAAAAGGIMTLPLQNLQGNLMPRCCAVFHLLAKFSKMDKKLPEWGMYLRGAPTIRGIKGLSRMQHFQLFLNPELG
ncbi:POU domain, class 6, transcription factor 2 [Cricetulus griseus]|uniref:POU domain, class 6, transcription factor 2 n=1 Tax=Cricetulus griseus TaxID=10029 RepID=G3GV70_CRIGR|nr:POU domain, class 6, transcription factor 2 [Cricetulus griseus]